MKPIASMLLIIALGFGLAGCPGGGGGGGGSSSSFAVSTTSADYGVVDNAYTSTLATTGGTAPFSWTLFGGALPTNLSIDQVTGVVSGTPTTAGNFTATFTVTDNTGQTATGSVLFAIHPRTDVVSTDNSTPPVPGVGASSTPSISSDGRFVAFASSATLIPGISGSQIYIHDWQTNQTSLVSRNAVGSAGNGVSSQPAISADGRFVTFTSASSNLTGDSNPGQFQIFLRDTQSNTTTLVSQATGGAVGDGASNQPSISSNGQFVTFTSASSNLTTDPDPGPTQIFLRDTQSNTTTLVSQATGGAVGDGASNQPSISSNGQFVAFTSLATTLAATPGGSGTQIFLRDTQANTTSLVSQDTIGNAGNGGSNQPSISSNGQFVAFTSLATTLAATPGGSGTQIFLRDTQANTTSLVSQTAVGGNAGNGASSQPAMSANGGFVAFSSVSTNFGAAGGNQQIYVRALP
jgi:Putative Ig domain/WD40-like Beta Propeller Repeat